MKRKQLGVIAAMVAYWIAAAFMAAIAVEHAVSPSTPAQAASQK